MMKGKTIYTYRWLTYLQLSIWMVLASSYFAYAQPGQGGTITTQIVGGEVYYIHTFTSSGTFVPPPGVSAVEYLVVGGGGGGGGISSSSAVGGAGGGGAGQILTNYGGTAYSIVPEGSYSITIGSGGLPGALNQPGGTGGNSIFSAITALGGGGGASQGNNNGSSGASGGGGRLGGVGGTGTTGYNGGNGAGGTSTTAGAGGGGGSSSAGANGVDNTGGVGGNGTSNSITGSAVTYAAGGKGGDYGTPADGTSAAANTGNGGNGADGDEVSAIQIGGYGGSGVVIIRYKGTVAYRSRTDGDWNQASTWQFYNGSSWADATNYPNPSGSAYPVIESTSTYQTNSTITNHTITLPTGVTEGDLLILIFRAGSDVAATMPSGYSVLSSRNSNGITYIWYKVAGASEGNPSVVAASNIRAAANMYRISNWYGTPEITMNASNTNDPPSITPSWGGISTLFIAVMTNRRSDSSVSSGPSSPSFTNLLTVTQTSSTNTARCRVSSARYTGTDATVDPNGFATSGTIDNPHSFTIAIQPLPPVTATIRDSHTVTVTANQNSDDVVVEDGGILQINDTYSLTIGSGSSVNLLSGSTLVLLGESYLAGSGGLFMRDGSNLKSGSANGLTSSGSTGNVRTTGGRVYSTAANFTFNRTGGSQNTGNGLSTVNDLIIDNSNGVSLSASLTVSGILNLTNGLLTTSASNILILANSSNSSISGASTSRYVNGPLRWLLADGASYSFPVGKGGVYYPFAINNVTGSSPNITVEAFAANPGGSASSGLVSMSTTEYWLASVSSGTYTDGRISLTRQSSLGVLDVIARSATQTGTYNSLIGAVNGTSIEYSIATGSSLGYFRMAEGRKIQTGTVSPSTFCSGESSVSVPYTIFHTANAGNVFTAQLSDASGSFTNAVDIGTATSTSSGTLSCSIPPGTPAGSGYRVRVIGSNPVVGGINNGVNLIVSNDVTPPGKTDGFMCIGASSQAVMLLASGAVSGETYQWYSSPSGGSPVYSSSDYQDNDYNPTVSGPTSYYVSIRTSVGCESELIEVLAGYPPASALDQTAGTEDLWVAHYYDGMDFDTYYGSDTLDDDEFNTDFFTATLGSAGCVPFYSEYGSQTISAESFSIRYILNSSLHGLYYVDLGSDDGSRLSVDGTSLYNNWTDQSYVVRNDVLIALNYGSTVEYEYYENGSGNQVSFSNLALILANIIDTNLEQELFIGETGDEISGDEYTSFPSGIEISGSGYQWSYSTTIDGPRTIIYGEISPTLTPNTANAPFNTPGTYYVRRNGVLKSSNNVDPTLAYATCESNEAVIIVYDGITDEFRSVTNGIWADENTWEQKHANGVWSNQGNYPSALSTSYVDFPEIRSTATSSKTSPASTVATITLPAGIQNGDLILIFYSDGSTVTTAPGTPSGFTQLVTSNATNNRRYVWYKVADGSEGTSVTTTTATTDLSAHVTYVIKAGTYTGTPGISSGDVGTDTSPNPPSYSPAAGNQMYLWLATVLTAEVGTYSIPANYSSPVDIGTSFSSSATTDAQVIVASRFNEASSEDAGAFTLSGAAAHAAYTLAIQGSTRYDKSKATIRNGHTVNVSTTQNIDTLVIESGGILSVPTGISLNVASNTSITVQSGGKASVAGTGIINGSGHYYQNTGGILEIGSTLGITSSGATGSIQNTGTRTFSSGAHFVYYGTSSQVTGTGLTQNTPGNLTINNSAGVTLSAATSISGILTMTAGKLNTTSGNLLSLTNTSGAAATGGSSTSFVDGPLRWYLPESLASGSTYTFPVGDGTTYMPFSLVNPVTTTGTIYTTVEAFAGSSSASVDATLVSLSSTEYWSLAISGNYTSGSVSLTRPSAISPYDGIAGSTSATGTYTNMGGTSIGTYGVSNSLSMGSNRYFRFAKRKYTWNGSVSTDWFTAGNWDSNLVPNSSSAIVIPSTINKPFISGLSSVEVRLSTNSSVNMSTGATLTLDDGPLFVLESSTSVTTSGTAKIILEPASRYVNLCSSNPNLEARQLLTGNKGWRNVSAPVTNSTYSDMFDNLVTQNFTGSNFPLLQPNLLWWDETNIGTSLQGWRQPTNISNSIATGRGHFHYVFDGAGRLNTDGTSSGSNYPDELPIVMSVNGTEPAIYGSSYSFSPFTYTERDDDPSSQTPSGVDTTFIDINVADAGWNLIGNPTASTLNWDASGPWTKTNVDNTIYIWDPGTNGGEYLTWNGTTGTLGSGLISPFQAFWVHTNAASPVLSFTNAAKSETASEFYGKSLEIPDKMILGLHLKVEDLETTSFISFTDEGVVGVDPFDGYRLEPMSESWLALYTNSSLSHSMPLVINNLSTTIDNELHIPLYINLMQEGVYTGGEFTLSWELPENWSSDLHLLLMDHVTHSVIDMTSLASYQFSENMNKSYTASSVSPLNIPGKLIESSSPSATGGLKSSQNQRFSIVIEPKNSETIPLYRKSEPLLLPVVPNPASEYAKLRFRLPEAANVMIQIYNQIGKIIDVPVSGNFPAGLSEINWYPNVDEPGIYLIKMISGETIKTGKLVLVK